MPGVQAVRCLVAALLLLGCGGTSELPGADWTAPEVCPLEDDGCGPPIIATIDMDDGGSVEMFDGGGAGGGAP